MKDTFIITDYLPAEMTTSELAVGTTLEGQELAILHLFNVPDKLGVLKQCALVFI